MSPNPNSTNIKALKLQGTFHIYLFDTITYTTAQSVIEKINLANQDPDKYDKIILTCCSQGGDFYPSFAVYDAIVNSKLPVDFVATGWVASCAVTIMQAARKRSITQNSYLMIHPSINSSSIKTHQEYMAISTQYDKEHKKFIELSSQRCNLTYEEFENLCKKEMRVYYTPEQSLELAIVDEII